MPRKLQVLLASLLLAAAARRPETAGIATQGATAGRRTALVIGNDAYPAMPLRNAVNDARSMAAALQQYKFEVDLATDVPLKELDKRIDRFIGQIQRGDTAMVYYAGHGIQIQGDNYLIPIDFAAKEEADAKYEAYSAGRIADRLGESPARLTMIVLDACRNNPYRATRSGSRGLAAMETGRGALIAFATGPNQTADDNPRGGNGLFTSLVLEAMKQPGLTVEQVFSWARQKVYDASGGRQIPWLISSVIGDFYFNGSAAPAAPRPDDEAAYWTAISEHESPAAFRQYLDRYPNGRYARLATLYLKGLMLAETSSVPKGEAGKAPADSESTTTIARGPDSLQQYFLKALDRKTYVPFIAVPTGRFPADALIATYYRVERARRTTTEAAVPGGAPYPYEDYQETSFARLAPADRVIQASFTVEPGDYVLCLAFAPTDGKSRTKTIQRLVAKIDQSAPDVTRVPVSVPDYWNGVFNTSSVMILKGIETLAKPLTSSEQAVRPFALGTMELHATSARRFSTADELSVLFLIYNSGSSPTTGKPDVSVDFAFYSRRGGQPERFFNRTAPTRLNADTLPSAFSLAAGHQLQAGQAIPLKAFAPGDYRLEITVEDRISGQRLIREVPFSVF